MIRAIINKIQKGIRYIRKYDVAKSLYWRWKLHVPRAAQLHIYPHSIVDIERGAKVDIKQGEFAINSSLFECKQRRYVSELRVRKGGRLVVEGDFHLIQGASIFVDHDAELILHGGWAFLNTNSTLNCFQHIEIGRSCSISDNVCIADSDSHMINGDVEHMKAPVIIGNHVWIGKNVTILKGVTIGDGAVVGAGSVVTKSIPARCVAVGNPARVIKENVTWK